MYFFKGLISLLFPFIFDIKLKMPFERVSAIVKEFHLILFMHNKMLGLAYKSRSILFSDNSFIFKIVSATFILSCPSSSGFECFLVF